MIDFGMYEKLWFKSMLNSFELLIYISTFYNVEIIVVILFFMIQLLDFFLA